MPRLYQRVVKPPLNFPSIYKTELNLQSKITLGGLCMMSILSKRLLIAMSIVPLAMNAATTSTVPPAKKCELGSPCWFEEWDSLFSRPYHPVFYTTRSASQITENEKAYTISIDMPGVDKKEINLEVSGNRIMVSGERKDERKIKEKSERSYSSYQQSFSLPDDADLNKIQAESENGVLKITVPKTEKKTSKKIEIK